MEIEGTKFKIEERIFTIRGKQVMLDRDLAQLYGVETKQLNRAVKRNLERFPPDFMFQIEKAECLRCQFGTLNMAQGQLDSNMQILHNTLSRYKPVSIRIYNTDASVLVMNSLMVVPSADAAIATLP